MRGRPTPIFIPRPAYRAAAALLSLLMVSWPLAAQSASGGSGSAPATSTSSSTKTTAGSKKAGTGKTGGAKTGASSSASKAAKKPLAKHAAGQTTSHTTSRATTGATGHKSSRAARVARTARLKKAFVASSELRPMAQQLALLRTPEAYAGVAAYARSHNGEAAAAAYLALGHAYLLDKRYAEAVTNFNQAKRAGQELADYDDFLCARANHEANNDAAAEALLHGFADRYSESIFNLQAPELEANVLLAMNNATAARAVLAAADGTPAENRVGFQLAKGQVELALGQPQTAQATFKHVLLTYPLSPEALAARAKLTQMGAESTLSLAELRTLGDAYYNAGRYADASDQFHALLRQGGLDAPTRNTILVSAAASDLKLKRLTPAQVQALPDTDDENGARRLDMLMELARSRSDTADQQRIVAEMQTRFPHSPSLADALFSSGNMYLLSRDYPKAVEYYGYLAAHFPGDKNAAAAHWKAGWLSYRQHEYPDAARIFDEQIKLYPGAIETVAALYWRARLYETQDHSPAQASANYRAIVRAYQHYFYAQMARARLTALGATQPASSPQLDQFQPVPTPHLVDAFPEDSPHLAKARLLANAGLNEYIADEIKADPDSSSWSALAEAQIYSSYGETYRGIRALKRALPSAASAPIQSIPLAYWRILFPKAWWDTIETESAKNHLDPYLVASLIRQESEFDPSAISYANAYGLMQLLPSVGKQMAREEGMTHFETFQLLDPVTNIRLGTRYLRQMLDKLGGVQEYALAAYNAGDSRVVDWEAAGPYSGMDEFVESIPFTQTREYVQAILRNMETYKAIDEFARARNTSATAALR